MSKNFKHTYYNAKALENQLLNNIVGSHDLICGCPDPFVHLTNLIFTKVKPTKFTTEDKENIKKCLGIGTDPVIEDAGDAVDGLTGQELEKLFEEDGEPDSG